MEKAFLERCLAEGLSLEKIGERVSKDPTTIGYWLKKHGLKAVNHDKYAPRGGIDEEVLEILVEEGASVSEMVDELGRSDSTVRHWLKRYGLEPPSSRNRAAADRARRLGQKEAELECRTHGLTEYVMDASGRFRCKKCRSEAVARRRQRVKEILVRDGGGRCVICGYAESMSALQFHHLDPRTKAFGLSQRGVTRGIEQARAEAAKCVVLCANCHAQVEAGEASVPGRQR